MLLYVYFAHKIFSLPVSDIEARLEYLVDGECASFTFTDEDMEKAEIMIKDDIAMMQSYLFDVSNHFQRLISEKTSHQNADTATTESYVSEV